MKDSNHTFFLTPEDLAQIERERQNLSDAASSLLSSPIIENAVTENTSSLPQSEDTSKTANVNPQIYTRGLVIGIGDLHGNFSALTRLLHGLQQQYKIFDNFKKLQLRDDVELVFTGDYIDRDNNGLKIIKTIMGLQKKNPESVFSLLGNHELLALGGLSRAQSVAKSGEYELYSMISHHGINGGMYFIQEFGKTPEEAFNNYIKKMTNTGNIGKWLRSLNPFWHSNIYDKRVLFVHGGIPHSLRDAPSLENYLEQFKEHVCTDSEQAGGRTNKFIMNDLLGRDSVFWDRSIPNEINNWPKEKVKEMLCSLGIDYLVIGHTNGTEIRNFHDLIFDIDVGMCSAYGGNEPAAIVFKRHGAYAFYVERGEQELVRYGKPV